jgi:hypothetical protein
MTPDHCVVLTVHVSTPFPVTAVSHLIIRDYRSLTMVGSGCDGRSKSIDEASELVSTGEGGLRGGMESLQAALDAATKDAPAHEGRSLLVAAADSEEAIPYTIGTWRVCRRPWMPPPRTQRRPRVGRY